MTEFKLLNHMLVYNDKEVIEAILQIPSKYFTKQMNEIITLCKKRYFDNLPIDADFIDNYNDNDPHKFLNGLYDINYLGAKEDYIKYTNEHI